MQTCNYFSDGILSRITVNKYKMIKASNSSILSDNIEIGEAISETYYTKYGNVSSKAIIEDGTILYYTCATGKMVTQSFNCD